MTTGATGRLRQSWLHLAVAFCAMGGWALFANRAHPAPAMLTSGLVQGCLSATITLVLKRLIETLVQHLHGPSARFLPPLVCAALSVGVLVSLHGLAGTPELLATIAVPVLVSTTYATIYTQTLCADRNRHDPTA
ncbi:MAG: hypothetical protein ACK4YU_00575 [Paracoccus sp. (in: a-proteobacteria)]